MKKIQIIFKALFILSITVCGKQADTGHVMTTYLSENIEYTDGMMPAQYVDDLSLLEDMKYTNGTYAYQDGMVFYRKYHEDSYEETALWGMYDSVPETGKEIVCIDSGGKETELFRDKGYGDIFLINNRFYMTEEKLCEENGSVYTDTRLYSVDMQGNDRIDYGSGEILAVDRKRNVIILKIRKQEGICYYVLNYETGEEKIVLDNFDDYINILNYRDGWLYYESYIRGDELASDLCAVSLEGDQREIITLTSEINKKPYSYRETILHTEVDEDRIYFVYGGYDGSAHVFQGGLLISVKLDGTDYKAVETDEDTFYLSHVNGKTLVYFSSYHYRLDDTGEKYYMAVWDIDGDICAPTDFSKSIMYACNREKSSMWRYSLCKPAQYWGEAEEEKGNVYGIPDDSGKVVIVTRNLEDCIPKWEKEEADLTEYKDLYYADGFLYFTVVYNVYDEGSSIGWRDGYRRLQSEVYRLKVGESEAELLYSY
ncbi:MAG: hypothetical protein HDR23_01990 [Lachnospiraceae bacterium]|nr:hypothetical protein [Lachnospiraceae bacterium]